MKKPAVCTTGFSYPKDCYPLTLLFTAFGLGIDDVFVLFRRYAEHYVCITVLSPVLIPSTRNRFGTFEVNHLVCRPAVKYAATDRRYRFGNENRSKRFTILKQRRFKLHNACGNVDVRQRRTALERVVAERTQRVGQRNADKRRTILEYRVPNFRNAVWNDNTG